MPHKDPKVELIRSVPLFAHCDDDELEAISQAADLIDVPAGMELVRQGAHTNEFVVVATGSVEVRRDGAVIDTIGAGGFFGEVALLTGAPRNATVTAAEPSSLLVLTDRAFRRLAEELPSVEAAAARALADRLHSEAV